MISESSYARDELLRISKEISKKTKRYTDDRIYKLEINIFISAFLIRKLLDSNKLPDNLLTNIRLSSRLKAPNTPNSFSSRDPWEYFDDGKVVDCSISLTELCNQLIHSRIFSFSRTKRSKRPLGLCFTSDKLLNDRIYFLPIEKYISIIKEVALAFPNRSSSGFDFKLKIYRQIRRLVKTPEEEKQYLIDQKKFEESLGEIES